MNVLLRVIAAALFLLAALGFGSWLVHVTVAHALAMLAGGMLLVTLAKILERTPRAG